MTQNPGLTITLFIIAFLSLNNHANASQLFTAEEKARILSHGPWPLKTLNDQTNRFSGNPQAIALGKTLFNEKQLSPSGKFSCSSCHKKNLEFADGLKVSKAVGVNPRNTPSLVNARFRRWFGWSGSIDTLWGVGLRALLNPIEMASSAEHVSSYVTSSPTLSGKLNALLAPQSVPHETTEKLVIIGKLIAAYVETIVSRETPFDRFRLAVEFDDKIAMEAYPKAAQRGLKLFVGRGQCSVCHFGPLFTNNEFSDIGISYFLKPNGVDKGRYQGIKDLKKSPFNSGGHYSDDKSGMQAFMTNRVKLRHRNWGEFRVPSLRSVANTAPYMHNGSIETLSDVVNHYSNLNEERLHTDGVAILQSLNLSSSEREDLVAFLRTLSPH